MPFPSSRSYSYFLRALVVLALALSTGCRGGPAPRFVLWEPAGGWLAAEEPNSSIEVRATVISPVNPDFRVVVEVETTPFHQAQQATIRSTIPATNEGRFYSARVPTADDNSQTWYRWAVQSAARVTSAGQPIVYARSDRRVAMVVGKTHPTFHIVDPPNGATNVGQPIAGDPGYVSVLLQFQRDAGVGALVNYVVRVEDENQRIQWFDPSLVDGVTETLIQVPRAVTVRCVPYGVTPYTLEGLGTYRVYVRGEERVITTRP